MRYVGGSSELVTDFDFEVVAQMVLEDAKRDGRDMRIISSYDSAINSNEYRMAIHTSNDDYHFMLQHSDGTWSHKSGAGKTRLINSANPTEASWDAPLYAPFYWEVFGIIYEKGVVSNYYDSETIYFAVTK